MTIYETTIAKIRELPEQFVREVNDFVDLLQTEQDDMRYQMWRLFKEGLEVAESDFGDYLSNLEDYESRLAQGEIKW